MGEGGFLISLVFFYIILLAFIVAIVVFVRQYKIKKKRHLQQIQNIDEINRQERLKTQVEIQTQTMKHIGREIHDNIGQKLTLASLYVQQLILENRVPHVDKKVHEISDILNLSLKELRELSKSLTSDNVKNKSLSELIESECERINNLKECKVQFSSSFRTPLNSYQIKSVLFRIAQEFLQNSIRHSNCENIDVSLTKVSDHLHLVLKDDGKGFDIAGIKSKGIGLKNIEKRTQMIGGTMDLESQPMKGTKLMIKIPL